jgi:hypothetical protein
MLDEWHAVFEWTIERAVCSLAGLPQPPKTAMVAEIWNDRAEETAYAAA